MSKLRLREWGVAALSVWACGCVEGDRTEPAASSGHSIIYGQDGRLDVYAADPVWASRVVDSAVAQVLTTAIDASDPEHVRLAGPTLAEAGVCADERFATQTTTAVCSGTLIAPDLVLTAGHCVDDASCPSYSYVFDYHMIAENAPATIETSDVYACAEVVARAEVEGDLTLDYAVVRLDRPATGRVPATVTRGYLPVTVGEPVVVTGCPTGLPQKIALGGQVRDGRAGTLDYFEANPDTFKGTSGGAFFRASGELVGILVRGPGFEYAPQGDEQCARPIMVPDDFGLSVDATYVSRAIDALCAVEFRSDLCSCGDGSCESAIGETSITCVQDCGSTCGDGACNGSETVQSCYDDCRFCGDSICDPARGENSLTCVQDCGPVCGDGGCNGGETGQSCYDDCKVCGDSICDPALGETTATCAPDCGSVCGDGGCNGGETVQSCYDDCRFCGDSICDPAHGENSLSCVRDCGPVCGDGACNGGETAQSCYADCKRCGDSICDPALGETTATCAPDCGSVCGDGGCNGSETAQNCYADCGVCGDLICDPDEEKNLGCCYDCGCPGGFQCVDAACQLALGNVNGDERVDVLDVRVTNDRVAGRNPAPFNTDAADVNCDGRVTSSDASLIDQFQGGQLASFPCEGISELALGGEFSCVLLNTGRVRCWGLNIAGELGTPSRQPSIGDNETAAFSRIVQLGGRVVQLAAGSGHVCALLDTGRVRCWGANWQGQLGYGNNRMIGDNELPASAGDVNVGGRVVQITAGSWHTCALLDTGRVRCWGNNFAGQLGYGHTFDIGDDESLASGGDVNVGGRVVQVAAGGSHTCALLDTGKLRCWGSNWYGQLGYGHTNHIGDDELPASAGDVNVGGRVVRVIPASNGWHTCALLDTGKLRCWGRGEVGQLGYGNTHDIGDDELPASAGDVDVGGRVIQVALSGWHTCALLEGGRVRCWGDVGLVGSGNLEHLGDDELPSALPDVDIGGRVVKLAAGDAHTCALLEGGNLRCFGDNRRGQLGYGNIYPVGDNEVPAAAGDVPFYPRPAVASWEFVNPLGLKVWMQNMGSNSQSTATAVYLENNGTQTLQDFRLLYLFTQVEAQDKVVMLQDNYTPWSSPALFNEKISFLHELTLDFAGRSLLPGQVTGYGQGGSEQTRIHFGDWATGLSEADDYSAADKLPPGRWFVTRRVQVVDGSGALVYGWQRAD